MLHQPTHRVVGLAAVAVLLVGAAVVVALVLGRSQSTGGAATAQSSTQPVPSPVPSTVPSPSAGPSSPLTASSAPGANALALAGTGAGRGQFTPATASFSLHTTYSCPVGAAAFLLVITDPAGAAVVTTQGPTSGDERRTITGAGLYTFVVSGGCSWTVEATG